MLFALLAIPAIAWWQTSILFVILLSLVTQVSTEYGAAEAADNKENATHFRRIELLLRQARIDPARRTRRRVPRGVAGGCPSPGRYQLRREGLPDTRRAG